MSFKPQKIVDAHAAQAEYFDVLIVGAGLSGIAAAYQLRQRLPKKRVTILDERAAFGGTWNLFRNPGVRSDPDMQTMDFSFRPWAGDVALVHGASVASYIRNTACTSGLENLIGFRHRVVRAYSSSTQALGIVDD